VSASEVDVVERSEVKVIGKTGPTEVPFANKDDLVKALMSKMRLTDCTVSVRESRQHAQFLTSERFVSGNVELEDAWALVDASGDSPEARAAMGTALTTKIMQLENYLYERICHMQKKNNLVVFPRDPKNPFVAFAADFQAALNAK
jgi:hypothetical protein